MIDESHLQNKDRESDISQISGKYIDEECFNEDFDESVEVEKRAVELKPYFSPNALPSTLYLQQNVLPLIFQGLTEVEKVRPKDPIEFFCAFILEHNKKEIHS